MIRVREPAACDRLLDADVYHAATAFLDGRLEVDGDLIAAVRWWKARAKPLSAGARLGILLQPQSWWQSRDRARRNIQFHYDRSNDFYRLFLDPWMQYSAAYFQAPSDSLEAAQAAKLDYILRKLDVRRGQRFLDVGCGWGGLVVTAAERRGASAVGCTLSAQQHQFAVEAIEAHRLRDRAVILRTDYRTLCDRFDRIASIGMYEHVGRRRLSRYFATLERLLAPGGLLLNSGLARPATVVDDQETRFIRRFVFPGGEVPYLADVIRAAEAAGLEVLDVENIRHHYARTCAAWVDRLVQRRDACMAVVDARTYRTWLLYLAGSVTSFEEGTTSVYHILLKRRDDGQPQYWTRRRLCA